MLIIIVINIIIVTILLVDHNRVHLPYINDDYTTDYINASYIYSFRSSRSMYIAAQGPLHSTINDFWRMVWQEQSHCIVMLTDIFSYSKVWLCYYWFALTGSVRL